VVAAALGVREQPGVPAAEALAGVLALICPELSGQLIYG